MNAIQFVALMDKLEFIARTLIKILNALRVIAENTDRDGITYTWDDDD